MRWLQSLFYNSYQKALTDPSQYNKPMKADDVRAELETVRDHESRSFMQSALTDATKDGYVTLERVVEQTEGVSSALRWELDRHMAEVGRDLKLGGTMLADHLLQRANRISKEIQTGATAALGDVLG